MGVCGHDMGIGESLVVGSDLLYIILDRLTEST